MSILRICRNIFITSTRIKPNQFHIGNGKMNIHSICGGGKVISPSVRSSSLTFIRSFFKYFRKPKKVDLKIIDNVPDQYSLIYRNTMDRYLLFAQIITTVSAAIVIFFTVIRYDYSNNQFGTQKENIRRETESQGLIYLSTFLTLVVLLQLMVYKLPIRIYYLAQQKKYIFVFHGNYPFTSRKLTCKVGEVMKLPEKGISPWKDTKYEIQNEQQVFLLEHCFRRSADLYVMLGVQKDPDVD